MAGKNGLPIHADDLRSMGKDVAGILKKLGHEKAEELRFTWPFWARETQLAPTGDWNTWLIMAGRGFGKSRAGVEWVRQKVKEGHKRIAVVTATNSDIERVVVTGESGFINACWSGDKTDKGVALGSPIWSPTKRSLTWANGAQVQCFSAQEPERLRGPQFSAAYCDELCLVADTKITTLRGQVPVQDITTKDTVLTRQGYKPVVNAWHTGKRETWKLTTTDGRTLQGTAKHPVMTQDGWKSLSELNPLVDTLVSLGAENVGIRPKSISLIERENCFTEQSMKASLVKFQMENTFITSMKTKVTTVWKTLFACPYPNTSYAMNQGVLQHSATTQGLAQLPCGHKENQEKLNATTVAKPIVVHVQGQSFVTSTVVQIGITTIEKIGCEEVYNLEVADNHEYFANGFLNHNCAWEKDRNVWDQLQFTLRLGKHPQVCIATTPKPTKLLREILKNAKTVVTTGGTYDNAANLATTYIAAVKAQYEGTRLGRQELFAEILDEAAGALWSRELLSSCEIEVDNPVLFAESLSRVIVSIDPAITANAESDMTGIVVAGVDVNGVCYILEDATDKYTPEGWATKAHELYMKYSADRIVAERNQGGDMVRHTLHTVDDSLPVRLVHASRGKYARAEPVSALYERNKVRHVRGLDLLEDQMVSWEPLGSIGSPDRLDALVWAITDLALGGRANPLMNLVGVDSKGLLSKG